MHIQYNMLLMLPFLHTECFGRILLHLEMLGVSRAAGERAGRLNNSSTLRRMHSTQEMLILGACVVAFNGYTSNKS